MKTIYIDYTIHQYFTSWETANKYYNILASNEKEFWQKWLNAGGECVETYSNVIYIDWENWGVFDSVYELLADHFTETYFTEDDVEDLIEKILACNGDNDKLLQRLYGTKRIQKIIIE